MDEIAIVGMAGRFPGARNVDEFWENLRLGVESIRRFDRDELEDGGPGPAERGDPRYVPARGVVDDVELFDARFFGFTPREAELTDPQHRLLLEVAWETLEHAGVRPATFDGAIGVFAGAGGNAYLLHNLAPAGRLAGSAGAFQASIHNKNDHLSTRIAYKLGLRGPAVTVQTACSTSLVAVAMGCQALADFQCDAVLAGGSNVAVPQRTGYLYHEHGIGSPDGHCRAFDAGARGTVPGNGAGMVLLKRLDDALAAGDTIHAVIRGWAVNNDGGAKVGYTAPGVDGQAAVIAAAQALAGVPPESIGYVEAHGTGTALGDPIEVQALTAAFRRGTDRTGFCALGSVKTNVGHLDAAAGVAGLIKAAQALAHGQIPPSLHFTRPNPAIDFARTPFRVAGAAQAWARSGAPRRAGVSSFGLGGTNAHLVLEEAPEPAPAAPARPLQLLVLSAQGEPALEAATARLAAHLRAHPNQELADVAWTLQTGRERFENRRILVCAGRDDALAALETLSPERVATRAQKPVRRPVYFLFPGQGAQHAGMARGLYRAEPVFRAAVDRLLALAAPHVDADLRALLFPAPADVDAADAALRDTAHAQPALFIVELALAELWRAWGVEPAGMLGHSIGEYAAACLAGVMAEADAVRLVAARGRLMQALPAGRMLSIPLPEAEVQALLGDQLSLAAVNGPELCVVSGPAEAVDALRERLELRGVAARPLRTSHAFHSWMMDPALDAFRAEVARTPLAAPRIPWVSNLSGSWITDDEATDPGYWARHLRHTVRFGDGVERLLDEPDAVLLEVGPGRSLRSMARWHPRKRAGQVMLASLPAPREAEDAYASVMQAVGQLWLAGVEPRWEALHGGPRRRVPLPAYPFQRARHWVDAPAAGAAAAPTRAAGERAELAEWFHLPAWREAPGAMPVPTAAELSGAGPWLVLAHDEGVGARLAWRLKTAGAAVIHVRPGAAFARVGDDAYLVDPESPADWSRLLDELGEALRPRRVVHLWSAATEPAGPGDGGLRGVLALVRALASVGDEPRGVMLVTAHAQEVAGGDLLRPEGATLAGAAPVIAAEHPSLACRCVDVDLPRADWDETRLVERLAWEALNGAEPLAAYRGGRRWLRAFHPVRLADHAAPPALLREGGVYLVTGGLGGIGMEVAAWLARTARARLVLTGRTAFPARDEWDAYVASHDAGDPARRAIERLREMEAAGARVLVHRADVAELEEMRGAVDAALARFGAVHGVVHAAGVPGGGLIRTRTGEQVAAVLAPKLGGARVIEALFPESGLDFVVLCSSRMALAGRPGQADYAAANAFLSAWARGYRARTGTHTVAIDWPAWERVGMAARARGAESPASAREIGHPLLDVCLREDDGGALFGVAMSPERRWVVDEHRIAGHAVVPGVAYVEMVRAALGIARDRPVRLTDVFFLNPLRVRDGGRAEQRLRLEREEGGWRFAVWSGEGAARREHALGRVAVVDDGGEPPVLELDAIRARLGEERTDVREDDREDDLGPRWRSIRGLRLGHRELLLELELPAAFEGDLAEMAFHPALLDRTQGIAKNFLAGIGYWLPFGYRRVAIHAPMTRHLFGWARLLDSDGDGETITFDFTLAAPDGRVLVEVDGFVQKRIADPGAELRALAEEDESAAEAGDAPAAARGIEPGEGIDALARILAARLEPQVVVSPEDFEAWRLSAADLSAAVPAGDDAAPADADGAIDPTLGIEERLRRVWQEVLGIDHIGIDDNYFELGGDSVQAIQIIHQARRWGIQLTPEQFFRHETVAQLAAAVRAASPSTDAPPDSPAPAAASPEPDPSPAAQPLFAAGMVGDAELARLSALLSRADGRGAPEPAVTATDPAAA